MCNTEPFASFMAGCFEGTGQGFMDQSVWLCVFNHLEPERSRKNNGQG